MHKSAVFALTITVVIGRCQCVTAMRAIAKIPGRMILIFIVGGKDLLRFHFNSIIVDTAADKFAQDGIAGHG